MRVGIIGFGIVGKSALSFYASRFGKQSSISVWDNRDLTEQECALITSYNAQYLRCDLGDFIVKHDKIIISPGVNLNSHTYAQEKFVCELDLFSSCFSKFSIALTGSLGKTTTTKLIGALIEQSLFEAQTKKHSLVGGNIGIGMLDLVAQQDSGDCAVLELSSFQLEFSKQYAPDIGIVTNVYPNHLDRHETFEKYLCAKLNLLKHQRRGQVALLGAQLLESSGADIIRVFCAQTLARVIFISDQGWELACDTYEVLYHERGALVLAQVVCGECLNKLELCEIDKFPQVTFASNWLIALGTLYIMGADLVALMRSVVHDPIVLENHHRVERIATIKGVDFYNDSKATVIQATQAAAMQLAQNGRPVLVILGGLGKGVDRKPLISFLRSIKNVKKIYCFGKKACNEFGLADSGFETLEHVMRDILLTMEPGDQVLFSPSGTSFDFFNNFEHRGEVFCQLVQKLADGDVRVLE